MKGECEVMCLLFLIFFFVLIFGRCFIHFFFNLGLVIFWDRNFHWFWFFLNIRSLILGYKMDRISENRHHGVDLCLHIITFNIHLINRWVMLAITNHSVRQSKSDSKMG